MLPYRSSGSILQYCLESTSRKSLPFVAIAYDVDRPAPEVQSNRIFAMPASVLFTVTRESSSCIFNRTSYTCDERMDPLWRISESIRCCCALGKIMIVSKRHDNRIILRRNVQARWAHLPGGKQGKHRFLLLPRAEGFVADGLLIEKNTQVSQKTKIPS